MKKKFLILLVFTILAAPMEAVGLDQEKCSQDCSFDITEEVLKGTSKYMEWDLQIPQVQNLENERVQRQVNTLFREKVLSFKREIEEQARKGYEAAQDSDYPFRRYSAFTKYTVRFASKGILSLTMDLYQYTGGAHGLTTRVAYNLDMCTGKSIGYKDIFEDNVDYKSLIVDKIVEKIQENPDDYFPGAIETVKEFTDEQPFYLTPEGIVIYYGLYELAPYAAGIQEFTLPFVDRGTVPLSTFYVN